MNDEKDKIIRLVKDHAEPDGRQGKTDIRVDGSHNVVAGGNINGNVNITARMIERVSFSPDERHISDRQRAEIQRLVRKLVEKEEAGGMPRKRAFAKWYGALKKRYRVTSYMAIPRGLGEEAITWLRQQGAIKRSRLRRNDPRSWRKELYAAIWARSRELGLSKGQVYRIVMERFGKRVSSISQLGERDLKKLHRIMMSLRL